MLTTEQKQLLNKRLSIENLDRAKVCATIIAALQIFMIGWFLYKYGLDMKINIIFYATLFIFSVLFLVLIKVLDRKEATSKIASVKFKSMIGYYSVVLFWGALSTVYDQTTSYGHVSTYLTNLMTVSVLYVTNSKSYYLIQLVPFVTVVTGFFMFQKSLNIVQAHIISILIFMVFTFLGSRLVYKMYVKLFVQEQELFENNRKLQQLTNHFEHLSVVDDLTQLPNRRGLNEHIQLLEKKQSQQVGVLVLDVDYFKAYNDHYGHLKGNEVLYQIATSINEEVQKRGQFAARFGGEEFVVVTADLFEDQLLVLAEMIRQKVENLRIPHEKSLTNNIVTVSIGYTTTANASEEIFQSLLEDADEALYKAKKSTKNCVMKFEKSIK